MFYGLHQKTAPLNLVTNITNFMIIHNQKIIEYTIIRIQLK
jgi:hypothetical protein